MEKKVVLILVRYYLPGSKSGGPGRSLANLINSLGDEFDFKVITSDRDWLDDSSYKEVEIDAWNQIGKAQVYYLSYKGRSLFALSKLLNQVTHDVMYLNSFFSYDFSVKPLLLRFLRRIPERPVILAARGELSQGALAIKYFKKAAFRRMATS